MPDLHPDPYPHPLDDPLPRRTGRMTGRPLEGREVILTGKDYSIALEVTLPLRHTILVRFPRRPFWEEWP
ncbi:MAG TPA: hypothetical protein PK878_12140 [bacterium]|nr:hypothetical protein [Candidatus Omnitrophota bacterium]HOJ61028.1 hypothetical protein [bacterium]HOL95311.1 hypothetical protein [bacterium]HPP02339.1 hypothetical protein [bacterium]HXK93225.1 hypothetical protein [bacterium]